MEKFLLQLDFDYGFQKHKYFNDFGVNIVEDLKLPEEDDWDMIIDKRFFGTHKLIQRRKLKRALDVPDDKLYMDITLGYPITIKDNIYEKFNDVHNITKKKRNKKLSPTMGGNIVSASK